MHGAIMPQGPRVHCSDATSHPKHPNPQPDAATAWCCGVPPLEPFIELTVRVPVGSFFGEEQPTHRKVLAILAEEGLGLLVDEIGDPFSKTTLRVRTADGVDRVYPIKDAKVPDGEPS